MVDLHKPALYDKRHLELDYKCADGIVRAAFVIPACLVGFNEDSTHSCKKQIKSRLSEMRMWLVWHAQVRFPHDPHVDYVEHEFDGVVLYCNSTLIDDKQVRKFGSC